MFMLWLFTTAKIFIVIFAIFVLGALWVKMTSQVIKVEKRLKDNERTDKE